MEAKGAAGGAGFGGGAGEAQTITHQSQGQDPLKDTSCPNGKEEGEGGI